MPRASHGAAADATPVPTALYRPRVSSTYRDDRSALLASMDALRRENEDLRAENLSLRVLVDPAPARASLAQLQGAMAATAMLLGAMVGAAVLARESHADVSPRPTLEARELPLAAVPLPEVTPPPVAPRDEPSLPAPEPARPAPTSLRAALRPIEPALARCLATERGDLRLVIRLDAEGRVAARTLAHRRGAPVGESAARCALDAASSLRLDSDGPIELRYTLRVDAAGLRVRRVRAR